MKFFDAEDLIEVANPPVLIYGQPGSGKTSIAQTGEKSLTLDFDNGTHRSAFRKATLRFETWDEVVDVQRKGFTSPKGVRVVEPGFANFSQINVDTVGTLLELMKPSLIADNAKNGTRLGGLSMSGWGVLGTTFTSWLTQLRQSGKQVVMIAHEKEEKDGDSTMKRPAIQGGSYSIVMQAADQVGYLSYRNGKRFLSWDPTDSYFAKNGASLKSGPVPDFSEAPSYLAGLLAEMRHSLGRTAEASAAAARLVQEWIDWIASDPTLADVNGRLPDVARLTNGTRNQVAHLLREKMDAAGYVYDKTAKRYVPKEGAAA